MPVVTYARITRAAHTSEQARLAGAGVYELPNFWVPTQLGSALEMWVDFNDLDSVVTLNGAITQAADKSGKGNHLIQPVGASQPQWSNNEAIFDGVASHLYTAGNFTISGTGARHVFVVMRRIGNSSGPLLQWGNQTNGAIFGITTLSATNGQRGYVWGGTDLNFGSIITTKQIVYYGNDGSGGSSGGQNGATPTTNSQTANTAAAPLYVALRSGGVPPLQNCAVSEIIIVSGAITAATRQTIEGYAAWHNGTQATLDAGHPNKNAAP